MTYQKALRYIHALHRFGRKPELTRIRLLLEKLGNPQKKLRFIHVAGTNGKGSTSTMIASIMREAGYRTGLYTSPYMVDFRERIVLDGQMISEQELADLCEEVAVKADEVEAEYEAPREFEFLTALALLFYSRHDCDLVVLEVGIGGQFDATNAIDAPLAAVICPIGLDHMELLGDNVADIAAEKCGIIKPGCLVITNPRQPDDAMDVIVAHCRQSRCLLAIPQLSQMSMELCALSGSVFLYHGRIFRVSLVGPHQVDNALTAIDTALALRRYGLPVTLAQIAAGIEKAYIPGRLEVFSPPPGSAASLVILDGAHNPHSMAALREAIFADQMENVTAVVGMLADKNCAEALDVIAPYLQAIVATQPDNPRAMPAAELGALAQNYCGDITIEPDCQQALRLALGRGGTVLVCGSLYLVSQVRPLLVQ